MLTDGGNIQWNRKIKLFLITNFFSVLFEHLINVLNLRKEKRFSDTVVEKLEVKASQNILEIGYMTNSLWHTDKTKICKINPLYGMNLSLQNQFLKRDCLSEETMFVSTQQRSEKKMTYLSDSFDSCYLSLSFEDLIHSNKAYELPEIKRVLKEGGTLYLSQQSHLAFEKFNVLLSKFDQRLSIEQTETQFNEKLGNVLTHVNEQFKEVNHFYYKNRSFICHIDEFIFYLLTSSSIRNLKEVIAERGIYEFKNYLLQTVAEHEVVMIPTRYDLIICRK